MDEIIPTAPRVPADWLDVIAESQADIAARRIVPGDDVMRDLRDSLARIEAKRGGRQPRDW